MNTRLTIVLGAGGVGKTTLAASLAIARARAGARVALLGVDPARRLRSALALADVPELGVALPVDGGALRVAVLDPSASLRRWAGEACADADARRRLMANPYFVALADRLAGSTDAIGIARAVESVQAETSLDELLLDTAPGVPAVELLSRPDKLLAFFDGRMMRWLIRLSRLGRGGRLLGGITELTGGGVLRDVGDLLGILDATVSTLHGRLEYARRWIADRSTSVVIVCGVSETAVTTTRELVAAVRALGLEPTAIVLNRALPDELAGWTPSPTAPEARAFARYVASRMHAQQQIRRRLTDEHPRVVIVPELAGLESASRLDELAALGQPLDAALSHRAVVGFPPQVAREPEQLAERGRR